MEAGHRPLWRHFIQTIPETDLATREVIDFGCNRGGFLRLLYALKPFQHAWGVDIARDSVRAAQELGRAFPIDYKVASEASLWPNHFDLAFSYEVIYLLADITNHATDVYAALKHGGIYYAVTGCHTESPLWPAFRRAITDTTHTSVQDRSPDDYAAAFAAAGFDVSVKRFGYDGFVPAAADSRYYSRLTDAIDYAGQHKLLFRLVKP